MLRAAGVGVAVLVIALGAGAQDVFDAVIVSTGSATVEAAPDYVEFRLEVSHPAATLVEAVEAVRHFGAELSRQLEARELKPAEQEVSAPAVAVSKGVVYQPAAQVWARLRFPAAGYLNNEDGPVRFAQLFDALRELATGQQWTLTGPVFGVTDRRSVERDAVREAMVNAYPPAEAAAVAMQSVISAVQRVRVEEVAWGPAVPVKDGSAVPAVQCRARVTVEYLFSSTSL